jgi:hypothetical protein
MAVLASIEPAELQVEPGAEASLVVRVRNRGTIVDRFDVAVVGPMAPWASVDPPALRLFPDQESEARVAFRPPRASTPGADTYPFGIAVRAASDPADSVVEEGRISVAPFVELAAEIVPQTSRGSRSGSHDINVLNRGNAVAEVAVRASDPDRLLTFDVRPPRMGLKPADSGSIRTIARPKDTFLLGSPKRVPFFVHVDEPAAGSQQISATLEQRPIIPGWVKPLAGLAVAGLAAILVLPNLFPDGGGESPAPTQAAVVTEVPPTLPPTPTPEVTPPPSPSPAINAPPSRFVVTEDLNAGSGLTLECPRGAPCRATARQLMTQILTNLQGKADGTKLLDFESTPDGALPLLVEWEDAIYQYTATGGENGETDRVRVDLAPFIAGVSGYVLVHDTARNQTLKYMLPPGDGRALYDLLYEYTPEVIPTPAPLPPGIFDYRLLTPIDRSWVFDIDWS